MTIDSIAVFPGTFDPVTIGHLDIAKRAARLVKKLIVSVADNDKKKPLFGVEERLLMLEEALHSANCGQNIEVRSFDGLLVEFMARVGARVSVRGLRVATDFPYELQMSCINLKLDPGTETIFLAAIEENQFISSSFAKEIARLGGDVSKFLPKNVASRLNDRIHQGS